MRLDMQRALFALALERTRVTRAERPTRHTLEIVDAMSRTEAHLSRVIASANDARREGVVTSDDLHEFGARVHNYADAIDEIADSNGLSDDVIAAFISGGE